MKRMETESEIGPLEFAAARRPRQLSQADKWRLEAVHARRRSRTKGDGRLTITAANALLKHAMTTDR